MNFASSIIEKCLKKYILNFNSKSFNLDIGSGNFSLIDTHLNCDEVNNLIRIPNGLQIFQAYCSNINISIENLSDISKLKIIVNIGILKLGIQNSNIKRNFSIFNQISIPKFLLENIIVKVEKILVSISVLNSDTLVLSFKKINISSNKSNNNIITKKFDIGETRIFFFNEDNQLILIDSNPINGYIECHYTGSLLNTINLKLTLYNPLDMVWNDNMWMFVSKFCLNLRHSINIRENTMKIILDYWSSIDVSFSIQITIKKWYLSMIEELEQHEYIFKGDEFNLFFCSSSRNDLSFNITLDDLLVQSKIDNICTDLIKNVKNRVFEISFNKNEYLISSTLLINSLEIIINKYLWEKINNFVYNIQPHSLSYFHKTNEEIQQDIYKSLLHLKNILKTNNLLLGFIENLTCIVLFKDINIKFKTINDNDSFTVSFPRTSITNKPQWSTLPFMKEKKFYNKDFPFEISLEDISVSYNDDNYLLEKTSITLFGIYSEDNKKCLDLSLKTPLIKINFEKDYLKLLKNIIIDLKNWKKNNEIENRDNIKAFMSLIDEDNSLLDIIYNCEKGDTFGACVKFLETYIVRISIIISKIDMTINSPDLTDTKLFFEPLKINMDISPLNQKLKISSRHVKIVNFYIKEFPFHINIEKLNDNNIKNFKLVIDRQIEFIEQMKELSASLYLSNMNMSVRENDSISNYENSIYTYIIQMMKKNFQRLSNKKETEIISWINYLSNFLVWESNLFDCVLRISKIGFDSKIHNINTIKTFNQDSKIHSKNQRILELEKQIISLKTQINNKNLLFDDN